MTLTDLKLTVVAFARSLLEGQIPTEEVTKKFLYEYLPPKIKNHLHELPYYDCKEEAHIIYTILYEWLLERTGFNTLSDGDLYEKVKNKIVDYLRSRDPKYHIKEFIEIEYDDQLHSPPDEQPMTEEEKDPIDLPSLEVFKLRLYEHPEIMIEYIKSKCNNSQVRDWLVKNFPSTEVFHFLAMCERQFLLLKNRSEKDFLGRVDRELRHMKLFDRVYWLDDEAKEVELAKIVKERGAPTTAQNLRKNIESQYNKRMKKYGYLRLSEKVRLKEIFERDKELKEAFDRFVPQLFLNQKS